MYATFNRFEIQLTKSQALSASHQGACDDDVESLVNKPKIRKQLDNISDEQLAAELKEYGAWDADELSDRDANERRIIWIAACNIREERAQ